MFNFALRLDYVNVFSYNNTKMKIIALSSA